MKSVRTIIIILLGIASCIAIESELKAAAGPELSGNQKQLCYTIAAAIVENRQPIVEGAIDWIDQNIKDPAIHRLMQQEITEKLQLVTGNNPEAVRAALATPAGKYYHERMRTSHDLSASHTATKAPATTTPVSGAQQPPRKALPATPYAKIAQAIIANKEDDVEEPILILISLGDPIDKIAERVEANLNEHIRKNNLSPQALRQYLASEAGRFFIKTLEGLKTTEPKELQKPVFPGSLAMPINRVMMYLNKTGEEGTSDQGIGTVLKSQVQDIADFAAQSNISLEAIQAIIEQGINPAKKDAALQSVAYQQFMKELGEKMGQPGHETENPREIKGDDPVQLLKEIVQELKKAQDAFKDNQTALNLISAFRPYLKSLKDDVTLSKNVQTRTQAIRQLKYLAQLPAVMIGALANQADQNAREGRPVNYGLIAQYWAQESIPSSISNLKGQPITPELVARVEKILKEKAKVAPAAPKPAVKPTAAAAGLEKLITEHLEMLADAYSEIVKPNPSPENLGLTSWAELRGRVLNPMIDTIIDSATPEQQNRIKDLTGKILAKIPAITGTEAAPVQPKPQQPQPRPSVQGKKVKPSAALEELFSKQQPH